MTTTEKRRRYPTSDSANESDDDRGEILNSNPQLTNKRRVSAAADFASHRFIVSERRQLAVLKQLTASDEINRMSFKKNFYFILFFIFILLKLLHQHHLQSFHNNVQQKFFDVMNMEKQLFI
jgi:hypothetical protein